MVCTDGEVMAELIVIAQVGLGPACRWMLLMAQVRARGAKVEAMIIV